MTKLFSNQLKQGELTPANWGVVGCNGARYAGATAPARTHCLGRIVCSVAYSITAEECSGILALMLHPHGKCAVERYVTLTSSWARMLLDPPDARNASGTASTLLLGFGPTDAASFSYSVASLPMALLQHPIFSGHTEGPRRKHIPRSDVSPNSKRS